KAATDVDTHLPRLLANSETAVDNLAELSDNFKQYQGLMGVLHAGNRNKDLFSYATGLVDLIEGQPNATIGKKPTGPGPGLRQAVPAKTWAGRARRDVPFLSVAATSKADVLHGLARTHSAAPWYIQVADQAPMLLGDWLSARPEGKLL